MKSNGNGTNAFNEGPRQTLRVQYIGDTKTQWHLRSLLPGEQEGWFPKRITILTLPDHNAICDFECPIWLLLKMKFVTHIDYVITRRLEPGDVIRGLSSGRLVDADRPTVEVGHDIELRPPLDEPELDPEFDPDFIDPEPEPQQQPVQNLETEQIEKSRPEVSATTLNGAIAQPSKMDVLRALYRYAGEPIGFIRGMNDWKDVYLIQQHIQWLRKNGLITLMPGPRGYYDLTQRGLDELSRE
jgi:hypothetical protein